MIIEMQPIGFVRNLRADVEDDDWGQVVSTIELVPELSPDSLIGLEEFSHVEVFFMFHRVPDSAIMHATRHPRGNPAWPRVGIFAQRGKDRPNRLGATIARFVSRQEGCVTVSGLDAIDGTPVLDLKPVMNEFLPGEPVTQPQWSIELMSDYWKTRGSAGI